MADIVTAQVFHARTRPKRNAFRYGLFYVRLTLESLAAPSTRGLFSIDRFNLFSVHSRDYEIAGLDMRDGVRAVLDDFGLTEANGEILLLTLPRVLGYAFNPVSFWLCHDAGKRLRAVIAIVNNTFGERHSYVCCHNDHRPIHGEDWLQAGKIFHVSPFLAVEGYYKFRFACDEERVAIWINHYDSERLVLSTSLIGRARPVSTGRLMFCFFRYPLVTLKVVSLIHYQAVKLFLKGIRHYRKPAPPLVDISR